VLLRRALNARIGETGLDRGYTARLWAAALLAAASGAAVAYTLPLQHPVVLAIFVVGVFGAVYYGAAALLGVAEARLIVDRIWRRARPG
jgi:putative peptidoglycan lipid II flippase